MSSDTEETADRTGTPAVVAKRADEHPVETAELAGMAETAGYDVRATVTQVRPEDAGTYLGRGKVEELAALVRDRDLDAVLVDGDLTPAQTQNLRDALPPGVVLKDRYQLVLAIFEDRAGTKRAQLQVELAQLQYDLPRIEADSDAQSLNKLLETGTRLHDARDRIDTLRGKLDALPSPAEQFRERRREEGFDLVTVAGYTNAGKSTLLHRVADDLSMDAAAHPDEDATAAVRDRLFETLETTTRRVTLGGRPTLFTDTVGYVADLPHWLVESFGETLSEAGAADAVVLVADASDPAPDLREKLEVSLSVLDAQGVDRGDVVTALNKVDLVDGDARADRVAVAEEHAPAVVPVSVTEGENVDRVLDAVRARLPTEDVELAVPNCEDAMAVVSWAHDHLAVEDVTYGDRVVVTASGRPDVAERARAKADAVEP